uniref:Uncharacterized protein n=1 Tax=Zea mays TaxID=4577 RepID=B4FAS4_MAIZE|nr:unknown [Zea mays]|eukprot:NP_001130849.1 uncharacterized protein LOC100191953 [Zea mays]
MLPLLRTYLLRFSYLFVYKDYFWIWKLPRQYTIPAMAMMLLEAALAAHLALNQHWIQELPEDRTGELHNLLSFIHNNLDLCKWAALAIFATQALSLLLAMTLRAMLSARTMDYDSDEDFVVIRRPLLVAQPPAP